MNKACFVFDTWALLAYLQSEEPARFRVRELLRQARAGDAYLYLSLINLGEVYHTLSRRTGQPQAEATLESARRLPIICLEVSEERVLAAARLKATHPISYADTFAVAAAQELGATLVTGDPEITERFRGTLDIEELTRRGTPRH